MPRLTSMAGLVIFAASMMDDIQLARKVFDVEISALKKVQKSIGREFSLAADLILQCLKQRGKVILMGIGKSGQVGQKISATFASTGTTSVVLHPTEANHGDLGIVCDGDVVIGLSYSGETQEILNVIPALRRFSIKLISFSGNSRSTLAGLSDVHLSVRVDKEACPFNLAPTSSTTAMLVLGDALAMVVLERRGFRKEDFARLHPGGTIGQSLLLRVKDIMRSGDRNPVIDQKEAVKEALVLMTKARAGSISVIDGKGKLKGIFTDGDFRRLIARDENVLHRKMEEVMTRSPICIYENALASEALGIFQTRNIDDLVVINVKGQPVGQIDLQDLPKLKIL